VGAGSVGKAEAAANATAKSARHFEDVAATRVSIAADAHVRIATRVSPGINRKGEI
jgi:hypothetical protein